MKLTKNFDLEEFKVSGTRPDLAAKITFNELEIYKLYVISLIHLEPLRAHLGTPIKVLSGKRTRELNAAVGGSPTSQHMACEAVDFTCQDLRKAFDFLNSSRNSFGQLLFYFKSNKSPRFIHISLPTAKHQGQILFNVAGKYCAQMP